VSERSCACGAAYDDAAWRELDVVDHIDAGRIRLFAHWPDEVHIEVRRCRCGRRIAATTRESPEAYTVSYHRP
jgi:hypothetical protein